MKFRNLVEVLEYRAKETPNNIAYTFLFDGEDKENNITYLELLNMAKAVSAELQKKYKKGDTIVLGYAFGLDVVVSFYACLLSGIIAVPIPPPDTSNLSKSAARLSSIIKNCSPKALLTTANIESGLNVFAIVIPELRNLDYISTDDINISNSNAFKKVEIEPNTIAFLQYTSGSTSEPRGVIITHENIIYDQEMLVKAFTYNGETKNAVSWAPFYHDMGLVGHILHPLYVGGRSILMDPGDFMQKPIRLLKAISKYKAFMSFSPNFAYDLCSLKTSDTELNQLDLSNWKIVGNSSEPIRKDTLDRFHEKFKRCGLSKKSLFPGYGLAEATLIVSGGSVDEEYKYAKIKKSDIANNVISYTKENDDFLFLVSSGRTILDQEIKIVDPLTLEECNDKVLGEIWVHGKNIAQGYWNNPEETNRIFKAHIKDQENKFYLRTGDVGFLDEGEVYIVGRLKDIIIVNGKNIYPHDIERLIESTVKDFPEIKLGAVAVFGVNVNNKDNLVLAMEIEPERNPSFDINKLISSINKIAVTQYQMSFYSMSFVKTGNLPKTSSGKLQRSLYQKIFSNNNESKFNINVIHKYERDKHVIKNKQVNDNFTYDLELKKWINSWFINTMSLKMDEIDIDRNLMDFITDSLFIIAFANDLEVKLNKPIARDFLYNYPTIRDILTYISLETKKQ